MIESTGQRVVIVGGGVAALETLLALHDMAGDRVDMTLIAPEEALTYRPMTVAQPFSAGHARRYELSAIAARFGAHLVRDIVAEVDTHARAVRTGAGDLITYDRLVLAVGAKAAPVSRFAITFGEDPEEEALHGLLRDTEDGYAESVAFVAPSDVVWTLPLYELALMTARQAWSMGADRVRFYLITPEHRPLGIFGPAASDAVTELLEAAGIEFIGSAYASIGHKVVTIDPAGRSVGVDRVVSLPTLEGPRIPGVPADQDGFIPVDDHGRVAGLDGVYAAGDGTAFPIKQGGLATQQADAVAEAIAQEVGALEDPQPFRPVLRGMLLTGGDDRFMRHAVAGGDGEPLVATEALWWPPSKIAGRYLAPYLFGQDELETIQGIREGHLPIELLLDHSLSGRGSLAMAAPRPAPARRDTARGRRGLTDNY
jgi:sulfide:quinone oxidoreductase